MELTALYDKFISEGFSNFYIEGVGGPQPDDVYCLGFDNQNWSIYYIERGQKSKPVFTTHDKMEAINFYTEFVSNIEHWHLVVFTRSIKVFNDYKQKLEILNIRTIQNDIPAMSFSGDIVHRLFVVNKDIFSVKSAFNDLPYFDKGPNGAE